MCALLSELQRWSLGCTRAFVFYLRIKKAEVFLQDQGALRLGSNNRLIGPVMSSLECPSLFHFPPATIMSFYDGWQQTSFTHLPEKWLGSHLCEGETSAGVMYHGFCELLFCIFVCHLCSTVMPVSLCLLSSHIEDWDVNTRLSSRCLKQTSDQVNLSTYFNTQWNLRPTISADMLLLQ